MRRLMLAIAGLAVTLAAAPSGAREDAAEPAPAEAATAASPAAPGTTIEMPVLIAPVTVNGRLEAYAYLTIQLVAASPGDVYRIREKVPFLQDAFVREVHARSIASSDDPKTVDLPALKERFAARIEAVAGPGLVAELRFQQAVVSPVRPDA